MKTMPSSRLEKSSRLFLLGAKAVTSMGREMGKAKAVGEIWKSYVKPYP